MNAVDAVKVGLGQNELLVLNLAGLSYFTCSRINLGPRDAGEVPRFDRGGAKPCIVRNTNYHIRCYKQNATAVLVSGHQADLARDSSHSSYRLILILPQQGVDATNRTNAKLAYVPVHPSLVLFLQSDASGTMTR
ncbi:hypothetical protein MCOR25_002947 [Pyricularia grisea]|nr:hypothetical protein MCOR25_002947 [Pyricularia grisea]